MIVEWFSKVLNSSRLHFYFSNILDKSVLEFQIEQVISKRGLTRNALETAFEKIMEVELKDRIFLRKELLLHLISGDKNTKHYL